MTSCTQTKHDWKMVKYTTRKIFLCTLFVCKVCVRSLIWPLYIDCKEVLYYNSLTSNATLPWYTNRKGHQYLSTLCVDLAKDQTSSMACLWACLLQQFLCWHYYSGCEIKTWWLNETNLMELFASFIYKFPLTFVQPMFPLVDGCLIYKVYRELHGLTPT
jgi:hypothetical protein